MKPLRINTLIICSIGLLLCVLLIVSGVAFFQARQTRYSLDTVLATHVPVLKALLDSQSLLYSTNTSFKEFTLSERVPFYDVSQVTNLLKNEINKLYSIHSNPYSKALVDQSKILETKAVLLSPPSINTNQISSEIHQEVKGIRHNIRLYAQQYSQEQIWEIAKPLLVNASNLIVSIEYELDRYLSQTRWTLDQLIYPLQQCLNLLNDISENDGSAAVFSGQEKLLLNLVGSLEKYKSAIALYYDEDLLEVSGANLEEIITQVIASQQTANNHLQLLKTRAIENISTIQEHIQRTTEVQQKMLVIIALLSVLVASVTSVVLVKTLSKRIRHLVKGAESITGGNLGTRFAFDSDGDQLNRLAKAFNDMAASLQSREKEAKDHQRQLARAQKAEAIGLMAGGVAHDLNNILSAVVGYPSLLLENPKVSSSLRKPLIAIKEAGERAVSIVSDLLTIAKGAAVEKEISHLNKIIDDFLHSLECQEVKVRYSTISFEHNLEAKSDTILCSSSHIQKCMMNLILNAAEAIIDDGVVSINTENIIVTKESVSTYTPAEGEYVVLKVADNGTGISVKDQERIFEPFYTKKILGRSGTGLGLAVVWNTIQDHDGTIRVISDTSGTCFLIHFPVREKIVNKSNLSVQKDIVQGAGEHILVVDDEPHLRDLASQMLMGLGYNVECVSSGEGAIKFLEENRSDIILLDMQMDPGMSGRQTYEIILQLNPGQKVVIASGYSDSDDIKATRQLGVEGFLKKPYTVRDIGTVIRDCLN